MAEVVKSRSDGRLVEASDTGPNIKRTFSVRTFGSVRYPTIGQVSYTVEI